MLDIKPRPTLAAATAEMMWAYAFATARVADAFAARSARLWVQMLRPAVPSATFRSAPDWSRPAEDRSPQPPALAAQPAFASYRSAGGHAAAQVILPR